MILNRARKFWKRRFALFPIVLNDGKSRQIIWLEWVWINHGALYNQVCLYDPEAIDPQVER